MVKGFEKIKKNRLSPPPSIEEASNNLMAPENAPIKFEKEDKAKTQKIDGRTLRKTKRTIQFATRVSPEFDKNIRKLAQEQNMMLVEILEEALVLFEKELNTK